MDLLGRKIAKDQGATFRILIAAIKSSIEEASKYDQLSSQAKQLDQTLEQLVETTMQLSMLGMQGKHEAFLEDASLYLEAFGIVVIAWQWLKQGIKAAELSMNNSDTFYEGKLLTLSYFYKYELPKTKSLFRSLTHDEDVTLQMQDHHFE